MERIVRRIVAMVLAVVTMSIMPLSTIEPAVAADREGSKNVYISEVKVGMGETDGEAKKELEQEGYTILKDDNGKYADLNVDAGSKSGLKKGANDKIVYLGYKTTKDPDKAITDLAVMNMNGGYSIEEYNVLMDKQMDSQIKPFVDRFIATLEEYRENYKKPGSSLNHIRADYMRRMLNRLTDDDTGGQPIGDLLLNKTKYELGDEAYNKLSDEEKKNHADILTILMQANGQATLTMETLLSKATDTAKDSWVDRFASTTLDDLVEEVQEEDKSLSSRADVLAALDQRYYDTAAGLLKKWEGFQENVLNYEDIAEELDDNLEDVSDMVSDVEDIDFMEASDEEMDEYVDAHGEVTRQMLQMQVVGVCGYLKTVDYNDGTLWDFFSQDVDELSGDKEIRQLYPIVDALTPGQIAGLDFLSFEDLFSIALAGKKTYEDVTESLEEVETVSVYEGVNREIYDKGGVALTSDALRAKAAATQSSSGSYAPGALPIVFWVATVGCVAATIAVNAVRNSIINVIPHVVPRYAHLWNNSQALMKVYHNLKDSLDTLHYVNDFNKYTKIDNMKELVWDRAKAIENAVAKGRDVSVNVPSKFTQYLSVGLAVLTVIMTIVTTVITLLDVSAFYDTKFTPIPKFMVDKADITAYNEKGEEIMVKNQTAYYQAVTCNRTAGDSTITKNNYEAMEDRADLNGDIGTEWLALYAVRYENGSPILADSLLYQKDGSGLPDGYTTGIHAFGSKAACDLNNKNYLFRKDAPRIKVFFKNEKSTVTQLRGTGSIFSKSSLTLGGGIGLIVGVVIGMLLMGARRKKAPVQSA